MQEEYTLSASGITATATTSYGDPEKQDMLEALVGELPSNYAVELTFDAPVEDAVYVAVLEEGDQLDREMQDLYDGDSGKLVGVQEDGVTLVLPDDDPDAAETTVEAVLDAIDTYAAKSDAWFEEYPLEERLMEAYF